MSLVLEIIVGGTALVSWTVQLLFFYFGGQMLYLAPLFSFFGGFLFYGFEWALSYFIYSLLNPLMLFANGLINCYVIASFFGLTDNESAANQQLGFSFPIFNVASIVTTLIVMYYHAQIMKPTNLNDFLIE
jgi:hypothetical protein